ncbi:hypothetical protein [Iodobacter ciconiae]|uniref:Polysaccharide biosynthesis protein n=1 Tax=Iodobacter ciconiae TaxID=2496266 RepID=A0A3S8ZWL9_9NEIS|nr:hypothetical protein [Iodobacter ciconiae]AZN37859.1 hypothetical protein EJO50_16140 [Iodobacter ciconiae]
MRIIVGNVLKKVGIDRAVSYVLFARGWSVFAGLITLYFISHHLTKVEQGFYYTFASVLAMQVFFELGFSSVISQFASHEMAKLAWKDGVITGDEQAKSRLFSLFKLAIKWYGVIAILMLAIVTPAGYWFFNSSYPDSPVNWSWPWIVLVLCTCGNLFISPVIALLEGTGLVADVAKMRLFQSVFSSTAAWLALYFGAGLFAAAIIALVTLCSNFIWISLSKKMFLYSVYISQKSENIISWKNEIFPMQWRIAISWLSGFFIFQLFTPLTFKYHGPEAAGQLGMSFSIANVLSSLAMAWITTKTPWFGQLIASKNFNELDLLFKKVFWQSWGVLFVFVILFTIALLTINYFNLPFAYRLLKPQEFLLILCAVLANHIVFAQATYVRAHKCEPYLKHAIVLAVSIGVSSCLLIKYFDVFYMLFSYFMISVFIGVLYSNYIYTHFKKRRR